MVENSMVLNALIGALFERSSYEPVVVRGEDMGRLASMSIRIDALETTQGFRARVVTGDPVITARMAYHDLITARRAAEATHDPRAQQAAAAAHAAWVEALGCIPPSDLGILAAAFDRKPTDEELAPTAPPTKPRLVIV